MTVTTLLALATLGDTTQIGLFLFFVMLTQGGQGKYKCVTHRPIYRPVVLLLYVIVAGNITPSFANVNTALAFTGDVINNHQMKLVLLDYN